MIDFEESGKKFEILHKILLLDLSMNDLRIMVGCLRAVSYLMKLDDEPYLDSDALELQRKLEQKYRGLLGGVGNLRAS